FDDEVPFERLHGLIQSADFWGRTCGSLNHSGRQVLRTYSIRFPKDYCPADRSGELTYIPGPTVLLKNTNGIRRRNADLSLRRVLVLLKKEFHEGWNIFEPIAQRRHLEGKSHPEK